MASNEDDLSSLLTGGLITIYVGRKRKEYQVHKDLLASHEFWRKYLNSKLTEDSQTIYLPDYDPDIWSLFVDWLYRGRLKHIPRFSDNKASIQVRQYVMLYTGAERWAIPALQNEILAKFRTWTFSFLDRFPLKWCPCKMIQQVYSRSPKDSPLRSCVVDSFLLKSSLWDADGKNGGQAARLKSQLDHGNQEFVLECFEALTQATPKSELRTLERRMGYVHYEHADVKNCSK